MKPAILAALLLAGCASNTVQSFAKLDPGDKTVTVPPGGAGVTGDIKQKLAAAGWKLVVYAGPEMTRRTTSGNETVSERGSTFTTRYTLYVAWSQFDRCVVNLQPAVRYDLSMVDNKTGTEVVTMNGEDCQNRVADNFMKALAAH